MNSESIIYSIAKREGKPEIYFKISINEFPFLYL